MSTTVVTRPSSEATRRNAYWRLFGVELRRFSARAAVRWLLIGMLAVVASTVVTAYRATVPPSAAQLAQAQQSYEQQLTYLEEQGAEEVARCEDAEAAEQERTGAAIDFGCESISTPPTLDMFLPYRTTFAASAPGWLDDLATFLVMIAVIVGATFVAAEFSTGSMSMWLTFEPRRGRVFASKVAIATLATGVAVLVALAVATGVTWLVCRLNDALGTVTPEIWQDVVQRGLRAAALAAGVTAIGAALAFLLRHTAAVVAVAFAWMVVVENLLRAGLLRGLDRWTVQLNLLAWLRGGLEQQVGVSSCTMDASGLTTCDGDTLVITTAQSGLFLLGVVVVVTVAALLVFRRRDVA